jgi:hypothetical protein
LRPLARSPAESVTGRVLTRRGQLEAACILKARELGASPTDIGDALGITRQAVYNRVRHLELRAETDPDFAIPDLRAEEGEETSDLESSSDKR